MGTIESCLLVGMLMWLGSYFGGVGIFVGACLGLLLVSEAWGRQ